MRAIAIGLAVLTTSLVVACSGSTESVDGVVVGIDTEGLGKMRSFDLRTDDGEMLEFIVDGPVDLSRGNFPPDHLHEHMAFGEGIAVAYEMRDGDRVVVRLSDAPWLDR